jgi:hypothetical protein
VVEAEEAEEPAISTPDIERSRLRRQRLHERLGSSAGSRVAKAFNRASKLRLSFTVVGGRIGTIENVVGRWGRQKTRSTLHADSHGKAIFVLIDGCFAVAQLLA